MPDRKKPIKDAFEQAHDVSPADNSATVHLAHPDGDKSKNLIKLASTHPLNDYGNGQRLIIHFGDDMMYVPSLGWFVWTGKYWKEDKYQIAVRTKAQKIWRLIEKEVNYLIPTAREAKLLGEEKQLRQRQRDLEKQPEGERSESYATDLGAIISRLKVIEVMLKDRNSLIGRRLTHAKNAGNSSPIGHMLTESTTGLAIDHDQLDKNPLDVKCDNGILRFSSTDMREQGGGVVSECELIPHHREQLITKIIPVAYNPKAKAPRFHSFLEQVQPDPEMRGFLQRWLGLSMSGLKVQKICFWYGGGSNGKSVMIDIVCRILGGYAATVKIESLTGVRNRDGAAATPDLVPVVGARLLRASEAEQGDRLQEALIKALTGGEKFPIRPNYGDQIEIEPIFKLTIGGNYKPEVRGSDLGIWRRILLVPWDVTIPDSQIKVDLPQQLWAEREGILAWLVDGLIDYLDGGLQVPACVRDATQEYREESDPIGSFLTNCCNITGHHDNKITSKELGSAFNYYLMERGESTWRPTTFAKQISAKAQHWRHPETGSKFTKAKASVSQYTGLHFTEEFRARWNAAPKDSAGNAIGVTDPISPDPISPDPIIDF